TSYRMIAERRIQVLHALTELQTTPYLVPGIEEEMAVLASAHLDLPFVQVYKTNPENAEPKLVAGFGTAVLEPKGLALLTKVFTTGQPFLIENLADYVQAPVKSVWPEACTEALIVPVIFMEADEKICLIAGISPRKKLDTAYSEFIKSIAQGISVALSRARAFIREQKTRNRLMESENRFRSMIDQAPVAIAVFRGKDLIFSKFNTAMMKLFGLGKEVIGQKLLDVLPEVATHPVFKTLSGVLATGQPQFAYNMPLELQRNNITEQIYFDYSYSPLLEDGQITGVMAVASEVTERFKNQQKLQESEALFRGITAASPIVLWITDATGNMTYVNETWLQWTGKPIESHYNNGWLSSVHPDDLERASAVFTHDFLQQQYHESHFRIVHVDGQVRSLICTGNPQFDDQQKFKGFIGACVDITEQIQLQRQKDDFLGVASHELKTPVTSIKAYAQVLEMMFRRDGDSKKAEMVGKLDKQVNRLSSLIGDLLDVTKLHSGRMQFNETGFNFNQLVTEVIEDVQHTSPKHQIKKRLNFDGDIWGDKERISQVITNLLTNAIKYSPDANEIIIYTQQNNGHVQLCVQDFGIGISAGKRDKVFEQFYRVSGSKEHTFPGLGLGLYISSEIIKRLNGRIWVNSTEEKGSTFCFSLPLKEN
ncbi:MAG: PAS domain S-box protein, partial [Sphingobacteriaceae bacterium]